MKIVLEAKITIVSHFASKILPTSTTTGSRMGNLYGYLFKFTNFKWVGYPTHLRRVKNE